MADTSVPMSSIALAPALCSRLQRLSSMGRTLTAFCNLVVFKTSLVEKGSLSLV